MGETPFYIYYSLPLDNNLVAQAKLTKAQDKFTLDYSLTSGGNEVDLQGMVTADGLQDDAIHGTGKLTNVNPRWTVTRGGTDNFSGTTKDATVLTNVRTALNVIYTPSNSNYNGVNGYIDLTLQDVTTLPKQNTGTVLLRNTTSYVAWNYLRQQASARKPSTTAKPSPQQVCRRRQASKTLLSPAAKLSPQ